MGLSEAGDGDKAEESPSGMVGLMAPTPSKKSPLDPMKRRSLMERQSDKKSDGGEAFRMSERIIKNTQAMTDSLRAQRGKCEGSIRLDSEELHTVERTLEEYEKGYKKVVASYEVRVKEREVLRQICPGRAGCRAASASSQPTRPRRPAARARHQDAAGAPAPAATRTKPSAPRRNRGREDVTAP